MKKFNRQKTEMFSGISQLDLSDFYGAKQESKTNSFSIIDDSKMNDFRSSSSSKARMPQPEVTTALESIEIALSDSNTKAIFEDVDKYENDRFASQRVQNARNGKTNVTNDIMVVDLDNDNTFIDDIFDSYESKSIIYDEDSRAKPKNKEVKPQVEKRERTQEVKNQKPNKYLTLDSFVPTTNLADFEEDDIIETKGTKEHRDEAKFGAIEKALGDASERQSELHHSIQIVLDDVKKHEESDNLLHSNLTKQISTDFDTDDLFAKDNKTQDIRSDLSPSASSSKTVFELRPDEKTAEINKTRETLFQLTDFDDEKTAELNDPTKPMFSSNFKALDEFSFTDNTNKTRFDLDRFLTSDIKEEKQEAITSNLKDNETDKSDDEYGIDLNDEALERIRMFAQNEAKKEMSVELAELNLEKFNLDNQLSEQNNANRMIDSDEDSDEDNLFFDREKIRQIEEIENKKRELELERKKFEEEKQKIADEFLERSERERESLIIERDRILEEAQRQKEEMIANAKAAIDFERRQLEEENEKLRQSIAEKARENQEFIEAQHKALLDAANEEKERLIEEHTKKIASEEEIIPVENIEVIPVQETVEEYKKPTVEIDPTKEFIGNTALINEMREMRDLLKEIRDEKNSKSETVIPVEEEVVVQLEPTKELDEVEIEMEAINENRSYTEKIIDDIEIDDAANEDVYVETIPFENDEVVVAPTQTIPTVELNGLASADNNQMIQGIQPQHQAQPAPVVEQAQQAYTQAVQMFPTQAIQQPAPVVEQQPVYTQAIQQPAPAYAPTQAIQQPQGMPAVPMFIPTQAIQQPAPVVEQPQQPAYTQVIQQPVVAPTVPVLSTQDVLPKVEKFVPANPQVVQPVIQPTQKVIDDSMISRPTKEFSDVDVMRYALNQPFKNELDFEEQRMAYQRDKVKEEIKRELLQEFEKMGVDVSKQRNVTQEVTSEINTQEIDTKNLDALKQMNESELKLQSSETVPELINHQSFQTTRAATKMYDFDLFDELGIEPFESNDTEIIKAITRELSKPVETVTTLQSEVKFEPFKTKDLASEGKVIPEINPEQQKPKYRAAQLVLNKQNKYDNMSARDLVKSYAKDIKRKIERSRQNKSFR